jgi:uncharacterized lipoprotein YmbA
MSRNLGLVALSVVVLLGGCFRSPNSTFYALTPAQVESGALLSPTGVGVAVASVGFPQYLDDPRILVRANDTVIDRLEYDRWAEDLDRNFMRVLVDNISHNLKSSNVFVAGTYELRSAKYQLQCEVMQFDVRDGGDAVLRVRWALAPSVDALRNMPFEVSEFAVRPESDSPDAQVAALSQLIGKFSDVVSAKVPKA